MKAYRRRRGIPPLIVNLVTKLRRRAELFDPADLTPGNNSGVHRTDWVRFAASLEDIRTGTCLTHVRIRTPNRPAHSVLTILTITANENY